jgi:hypothetical protein
VSGSSTPTFVRFPGAGRCPWFIWELCSCNKMFAADLGLNGDVTLCLCQECTNSAKWVGELACVI